MMISSIFSKYISWVIGALIAVVAMFGMNYRTTSKAVKREREKLQKEGLERYAKSRQKIDKAGPVDRNVNNARQRLRNRQRRGTGKP